MATTPTEWYTSLPGVGSIGPPGDRRPGGVGGVGSFRSPLESDFHKERRALQNALAQKQLEMMEEKLKKARRSVQDEAQARGDRLLEPYRQQKRSPGEILRDKIANEHLKKLKEEAANRQAVYAGVGPNALGNVGAYKAGRVAARGMFTGGDTGRTDVDPYGDPGIGTTRGLPGFREAQGQDAAPYAVEGTPLGPAQPLPPWMRGKIRPQPDWRQALQDTRSILGGREKGGTIPKTGPYELHEGEIVISADQVDRPLMAALKEDKLGKLRTGQMDGEGTGPGFPTAKSMIKDEYRGGTLGSYQKGFGPATDFIDDYWRQFILDENLSNLPGGQPESRMTVPGGPRRGMPPADWERFISREAPPGGRGGAMVPSRGGGVTPGRGGGAMSVLEGGMDLPPSSGELWRAGAPPGAGGGGDIPNVESMWDKWRVTGTRSPGGKGARTLGSGARAATEGVGALGPGAGAGVDDALTQVAKRTKIPAKSLRGLGWKGLIAVAGAAGAAAIASALFGGDDEAAAADVIPGQPPGLPPEEALLGGGPEEMTPEDILALEPGGGAPQGDKFDEWTQQYQAQQEEEQRRKQMDLSLLERGAPRPEAAAAPEDPSFYGGTGEKEDPFTLPSMSDEEFERSERKAKYVRDKMDTERDKEAAVRNNMQADRLDRYLAGNASNMDQAQWQQMTQQVARLRKSAETTDKRMEERKTLETTLAADADKAISEYRKAVNVAMLEESGEVGKYEREKIDTLVRNVTDKYDAYSEKFSEGKITGTEGEKAAKEKMAKLSIEIADAEGSPMTLPIARIIVEWDLGIIDDEQMEAQFAELSLDDDASRRAIEEMKRRERR